MAQIPVLPPGITLKNDTYRIERLLGTGGFGYVYLATDLIIQKPCAIKESFDTSPGAQAQFEIEARILKNLNHPHLVRVTDSFIEPSGNMLWSWSTWRGKTSATSSTDRGRCLKTRCWPGWNPSSMP